ncbi:hypothetical protein [Secundilactobacillus paracollinoides]|uniref:hypothetical protein n=1 Tax=Secundilactobacillus paracollinoides TaxID=240427 RepID=UPI000A8279BC|nr:hypothetical protein [Secundilactobacillus paracollinoides]
MNRFLVLDLLLGCFGDANWCAIVETVQQRIITYAIHTECHSSGVQLLLNTIGDVVSRLYCRNVFSKAEGYCVSQLWQKCQVQAFLPVLWVSALLSKRVQQGKGLPCNGLWQKCQTQAFLPVCGSLLYCRNVFSKAEATA